MPKNLLILAESIDPNDSSGTKGRVALINNLAKAGFQITVLHYTRRNISLKGIKTIMIKERKFNLYYLLSKIQKFLYKWFNLNIGDRVEQLLGFSFTFFNDSKSMSKALNKFLLSKVSKK